MSDRRFWRILGLIVLVAAAMRVGHIAAIHGTPLWHFAEGWVTSDMHTNLNWADHLASGDWLDRETFRPKFPWQAGIASQEVWNRWLGPEIYYQPPLYAYLLALTIRATGSPDFFRVLQVLLGAANVGLVGLLGWKTAGRAAGLIAAGLAALYAPWILYDGELLRGTLAITTALLSLLALLEARRRSAAGLDAGSVWQRYRFWGAAGVALGIAYLTESAIVTFIPLALLWALFAKVEAPEPVRSSRKKAPPRTGRTGAGVARSLAIVAGLLAAISPLMLRNLIVGAPITSATTRAPLAFVMGNAPETMPVGASIPPGTREILNASEYRLLPTIIGTLRAYHGQVGRYLLLQWRKLSGLFGSYEVPDNPSFYYAALDSPVLRYGLRFSCIVGFGLVGMILGAGRLRGNLLLYLYTVAILSLFLAAQVVSRYRQPLLIPLFVFAGLAIARAWEFLRSRRVGVAAAVLAGSVAVSFAMPLRPPHGYRYYRPAEFLAAAGYLEEKGEAKAAGKEIHRAVSYSLREDGPSDERIEVEFDLTQLYLRHRMFPQALSVLHDILDERPNDAEALATKGAIHQDINQPWQALQYLTAAAKADPNNAEVHARLGHLYWFVFESPDNAVIQFEKALKLEPSSPAAPRIRALIDQIKSSSGKPS